LSFHANGRIQRNAGISKSYYEEIVTEYEYGQDSDYEDFKEPTHTCQEKVNDIMLKQIDKFIYLFIWTLR
jgi:hypothetical protein